MRPEQLTDCHIHIFALKSGDESKNEIIVQSGFFQRLSYRYISNYHNLPLDDPQFNKKYTEYLNNEIENSRYIKKGIVFGMDGIYDSKGKLDKRRTQLYISNNYVLKLISGNKNLKFGVSVNPAKKNAAAEIEWAAGKKAALNKVLPNSQGFDPADKKYKMFFRKMADHKLPLLTHCGFEFAIKSVNQKYGNPDRLRQALDEGVNVIAAHGAASGLVFFEMYKKTIIDLVKTYPNLYLDISALSVFTRVGIVPLLRKNPEIKQRLLFGTDFPLPVHLYPFYFILGAQKISEIKKIENYFDRYAVLMEALGLLSKKPALKF